jgi:voltage-gated potassium channel
MGETAVATTPTRQDKYSAKTNRVLFVMSVIYITAYSFLILARDLGPVVITIAFTTLIAIWVLFIVDYIVRVALSRNRWRFIGTHIPDLLTTIAPVFRPLVEVGNISQIPYFARKSGAAERIRLVVYAVVFTILFVYTIALAVYAAERDAVGASITSFGDSLWWACVTMTSVGYGDYVPITIHGRILAVLLMFGGLAIIGVATATIISYLTERIALRTGAGTHKTKV